MSESDKDRGASSDALNRPRTRCAYDEIIRRRQDGRTLAMGKHTAANAASCERIISNLEAAGMKEEASWALWMVWWRSMDWDTSDAIAEMYREEIGELKMVIEKLKQKSELE